MLNKIAFITLGCAKNQVDSEFMAGSLSAFQYLLVTKPELADAVVINTCCFIDAAKEETVNTILGIAKLKSENPQLKLVVVGCASQKYGQELLAEIPEIDAVLGTGQLNKLREVLDALKMGVAGPLVEIKSEPLEEEPTTIRQGFTKPSAYLKIADGCNNHCTYCVIPEIRGPYQSRSIESLVAEASYLVDQGVREICLVAQDVTAYGLDLYKKLALPQLLRELAKIENLNWIRLFYCYPTYITRELLNVIATEDKVCKYLDIPLQHAHDTVLKKMGRKGSRKFLEELLAKIRSTIPDIALRTTFIVGFPGETEEEFVTLLSFMKEHEFHWAGVFTYSQEEGTQAGQMGGQIPEAIKEERYHRSLLLQREITLSLNKTWLGATIRVMIENVMDDGDQIYLGRAEWQAPEVDGIVYVHTEEIFQPGDFVNVKITAVEEYDLVGELAK